MSEVRAGQATVAAAAAAPAADERKKLVSRNPSTQEVVGELPICTKEDVHAAVERARAAFPAWSRLEIDERLRFLARAREIIVRDADRIAELITSENGKPLVEALGHDILPALQQLDWLVKNAKKALAPEPISAGLWELMRRESYLIFAPSGVVAVIGPFNYPFYLPMGPIAQALVAGNTVVFKPSEYTSLVGKRIVDAFIEAGVPAGVLELATGDGGTGAALTTERLARIAFIGSVPTGKRIMAAAAQNLTPVILELGGKDPMVVLEDADIELAANAAAWGVSANAGQTCAHVQRLYAVESVYDTLVAKVVENVKRLRIGDGKSFETDFGPIISAGQIDKCEAQVEKAKAQGARVLAGGERLKDRVGNFYPPTILADAPPDSAAIRDEIFGPVLTCVKVKDAEEALRLANDSPLGLTASVFTRDIERGKRFAERLEAGAVMVNDVVTVAGMADAPWGGVKESGVGRMNSKYGLRSFADMRHVHVNRLDLSAIGLRKQPYWYPYGEALYRSFRASLDLVTGTSVWGKIKAAASTAAEIAKGMRGARR